MRFTKCDICRSEIATAHGSKGFKCELLTPDRSSLFLTIKFNIDVCRQCALSSLERAVSEGNTGHGWMSDLMEDS